MVKVKICGVTRDKDLNAAVRAGADAIGFVVNVEKSPRNLSLSQARDLMGRLPNTVDSVAVTIFKDLQGVTDICRELTPNFIQLHGMPYRLDNRMIPAIDTKLIAAVDVRSPDALEQAIVCSRFSDALLVDTYGDNGLGGTGRTHNWGLSRSIRDVIQPAPMILAGGLTPENVDCAIRTVKPCAVDVSTGVELRPGIKNHMKISEFVRKVKEIEK